MKYLKLKSDAKCRYCNGSYRYLLLEILTFCWFFLGEADQTLNQLLVEMDGMSSAANVILMASTNRSVSAGAGSFLPELVRTSGSGRDEKEKKRAAVRRSGTYFVLHLDINNLP